MATEITTLETLNYLPYLNDEGLVNFDYQNKVGVYAIFDENKVLQFIGYSRDVSVSLKQHLARMPQQCYWFKVQTIDRPSRTILEEIRTAWIAENGSIPTGNNCDEAKWTQPIDVKTTMNATELAELEKARGDELAQMKLFKQAARRAEAEILAILTARGVQESIRFNPKLKESGLLDLK